MNPLTAARVSSRVRVPCLAILIAPSGAAQAPPKCAPPDGSR